MVVKFKFDFQGMYSKKVLSFVSLLFMVVLVFSSFVLVFSGVSFFALGVEAPDEVVKNEAELVKAVNAAPLDKAPYVIGFSVDIVLKKSLEIPVEKNIVLVSVGDGVWKLVGPNKQNTITVKGLLTIDGIIVSHADGKSGSGVFVSRNSTFTLLSGAISGNTARVDGGGMYNEGTFVMAGGEITDNIAGDWGGGVCNYFGGIFNMTGGEISNNKAAVGGGVFNGGTFSMSDGEITGNTASAGGGVTDSGSFYKLGGVISDNTSSDVVNDLNIDRWKDMGDAVNGYLIVFILAILVIVCFACVVVLLFYHSKKRKQVTA